jgi:hypothetical protein
MIVRVLSEILGDAQWQMTPSERAALMGLLAELAPGTAIEVGTGGGGSLRAIAAKAKHVHAFDVVAPAAELAALPNVTFHTGDSHVLLPRVLDRLARENASVEFVLVDGDHTSAGVRRDVEDVLASPAVARGLILLHDTANDEVRRGIESVDYATYPKVTWVDLDWLPGYVERESGKAWSGMGLIAVDAVGGPLAGPAARADYAIPLPQLIAAAASWTKSSSARSTPAVKWKRFVRTRRR